VTNPKPFPTLSPLFDSSSKEISDGFDVGVNDFCRASFPTKPECASHYASLSTRKPGYFQCPFGFTTRSFFHNQQHFAITSVVASPRFDTANERAMAKRYPDSRVSRAGIERNIQYLDAVDKLRADAIESASKVLPQAFHELRKLNAAVLQHAESEMQEVGESRRLLSIKSAAELMRNNFDILEALSNIEGIRALPNDSTINLFDLAFKMKRVFEAKARERDMNIQVNGVRAIVWGSQKSFPIVPAVLIENAIKYGERGSTIFVDIGNVGRRATIRVENRTTSPIDSKTCFDRGKRFNSSVEGGGFGLYLAREVVRCHQGTISCESGQGSVRMSVDLPLHTVIPMSGT
jgi:signal transduction histidine kinase